MTTQGTKHRTVRAHVTREGKPGDYSILGLSFADGVEIANGERIEIDLKELVPDSIADITIIKDDQPQVDPLYIDTAEIKEQIDLAVKNGLQFISYPQMIRLLGQIDRLQIVYGELNAARILGDPGRGYWYVATPFSGQVDQVAAFRQACEVVTDLQMRGIPAVSPIVHGYAAAVNADVPLDSGMYEATNEALQRGARGLLVVRLPGWNLSHGIKREIVRAERWGQPIKQLWPTEPLDDDVIKFLKGESNGEGPQRKA